MRKLATVVALAMASACGGSSSAVVCGGPTPPGPGEPMPPEYDQHADDRRAPTCRYHAMDHVDTTVGPNARARISQDLHHVIVVMRENRSFDNLLGAYDSTGLENASNPDPRAPHAPGTPIPRVPRFHETRRCASGPGHDWDQTHLQYNGGQLDGFVTTSNRDSNNSGGCAAMGYYDEGDVPLYYALARNFAISESYYASLLGPTMPNLMYYFFATSCGKTGNNEAIAQRCPDQSTSIFELLGSHSHAVYSDATLPSLGGSVRLTEVDATDVRNMSTFVKELADDATFPEVAFVEPNYHAVPGFKSENDDHPPSNIQDGEALVREVLADVMSSPVWQHAVVFVTWDEHGGYYDHVSPPEACMPDDMRPRDFDFDRYGFRTPFFAISPFAIKGYVSHYTADHTSILRFIETWLDLGALTNRDANAWPLLDMFDFSVARTDFTSADLPATPVDPIPTGSCDTSVISCCQEAPPCVQPL